MDPRDISDYRLHRVLSDLNSGILNWEVDGEGELTTWGYDAFESYETREDGLPDYEGGLVTHESLRKLASYLESGEEVDIQTAGFTKCRFLVVANGTSLTRGTSYTPISAVPN